MLVISWFLSTQTRQKFSLSPAYVKNYLSIYVKNLGHFQKYCFFFMETSNAMMLEIGTLSFRLSVFSQTARTNNYSVLVSDS